MASIKIIHIDDSQNDLELTRMHLLRILPDLQIDSVETIKEASQKIKENRYDCILCDYQLNKTTGFQLLRSLHEQGNSIPFIFLTGQGNELIASEALHLGADDYFSKAGGFALYERLLNSIKKHVKVSRQQIQNKLAERELRKSQMMLQLVLNSIPARVFWKDKNLKYLGCNRQMAVDAGLQTPEEIIGKSDYDLPWREQAEIFRSDDKHIIETGEPKSTYEEPQNRLDGTSLILKKNKFPLTDLDGSIIGVLGVYEDITERKQVEETLRASEERYKSLLENASDGILISDIENNFVIVNSRACEMLGYTKDELLTMTIKNIIPVEDLDRQPLRLDELRANDTRVTERRLLRKNGTTFPVEINTRKLSDGWLQAIVRDITKRKESEEILRESEERFRSLFENLNIGLYRTTPDGRILMANPTLVQMLAYESFEELAKINLEETEYARAFLRSFFRKQVERDGQVIGFETTWKRKDGTPIQVRENAKVILDDKGNIAYYEGTVEDITEQKKSARLLQSVFASLKDAVFVIDPVSRTIISSNAAAERIFGYSEQELIGSNTQMLHVSKEAYLEFGKNLFPALGRDGVFNSEFTMRRKDGSVFISDHTITEIVDENGQRTGVVSVVRDFTEKKSAEEEMKIKDNAMESSISAISIVSLDGYLTYVNPTFVTMFKCKDKSDALGRHILEFCRSDETIELAEQVMGILNSSGYWIGELQLHRMDGEPVDVEITASLVRDDQGEPISMLGSLMDVTQRKRAEEGLIASRDTLEKRTLALEAANRELESFSYTVSHDLRAPIRHIASFANLLLDKQAENIDKQGHDYLQRIIGSCKKMNYLIDNILNLSRLGRVNVKREKVNLSTLAKEIASDLQLEHADREIEIEIQNGITANCDSHLLELVLMNLMGNAVKFTSTVSPAKIVFTKEEHDGKTVYIVRDNGIGFENTVAESLFTTFTRLHDETEFEGSGIGLATVKKIVERHGGHVWAEGKPGGGASIYFTLS